MNLWAVSAMIRRGLKGDVQAYNIPSILPLHCSSLVAIDVLCCRWPAQTAPRLLTEVVGVGCGGVLAFRIHSLIHHIARIRVQV